MYFMREKSVREVQDMYEDRKMVVRWAQAVGWITSAVEESVFAVHTDL